MRKQILKMQEGESFPFCWVKFDSDSCIDVQGHKIEIYIKKDSVSIDDMKSLFCDLFGTVVDELSIFSPSWWDFCIDTWNIQTNPKKSCYLYKVKRIHFATTLNFCLKKRYLICISCKIRILLKDILAVVSVMIGILTYLLH